MTPPTFCLEWICILPLVKSVGISLLVCSYNFRNHLDQCELRGKVESAIPGWCRICCVCVLFWKTLKVFKVFVWMKLNCSVILKVTFYAGGCLTTVLMCHQHRACKRLELRGKQTAIFLPAAWNSSHLSRTGRRQHDPTGCPSPSMPWGVFASWTEDWMEMQLRNGRWEESGLLFGSCLCAARYPLPTSHILETSEKYCKQSSSCILFAVLYIIKIHFYLFYISKQLCLGKN